MGVQTQEAIGNVFRSTQIEIQTHTVRIDLTSKDGREIIDKLLSVAHAPGAAVGRAKNGSAAIVFRSSGDIYPSVIGAGSYDREFKLASRDGAVRITISTDNYGAPAADYKFDGSIVAHELPVLNASAGSLGARVINAAFELDFSWASIVDDNLAREERARKLHADIAAGRVKVPTVEEAAAEAEARRDAEVVAANVGREVNQFDGPHAQMILGARARHAARQATKQTAAA